MQALIVADVAKLYWKKTHLERTVVANRVSERRRVNETLTMHNADENSGDAPLDPVALSMGGYRSVPDSGEAYEESTHLLNRLLQWVEERDWTGDVAKITTLLYGEELPPHGREILDLYGSLANTESEMTDEDERTAAAQLRNVIMLEKASVLVAQTVFRVGRRDRVRLSLGSAWVPTSPNWDLMVAQDAHLDRMIESKIRLLIRLQGPEKGGRRAAAALGSGRETDDEDAIPVEAIIHRHPSATMVETGGDVPRSDGENAEKDPFEKLTVNVV
jgi:hypothetical protein